MAGRLTKLIAVLLHPLLMPLYATWLLLHTGSWLSFATPLLLQYFLYAVIFISTALLPTLSAMLLVKQGWIQSLEMPERKERTFPFLITLGCYASGLILLYRLPIPRIYGVFLGGGMLAILLAFLINLRWKISIHMIGIGGLIGLLIGYSQLFELNIIPILILLFILSGILGTARLFNGSHSPAQIYVGFLGGLVLEYFYIYLLHTNYI